MNYLLLFVDPYSCQLGRLSIPRILVFMMRCLWSVDVTVNWTYQRSVYTRSLS